MANIYFTKIEFTEWLCPYTSHIVIDIPNEEMYVQRYKDTYKRFLPSSREEVEYYESNGELRTYRIGHTDVLMKSGKTGERRSRAEYPKSSEELVYSYGIKLQKKDILGLKPYTRAMDFEPYRDREMSMNDEGYIGYRDEVSLYFCATSDSYLPLIRLPMMYYYDEEHIWPSEKLYRYLYRKYLSKDGFKEAVIEYGGCSLFGC